jgi:hypothetical protein
MNVPPKVLTTLGTPSAASLKCGIFLIGRIPSVESTGADPSQNDGGGRPCSTPLAEDDSQVDGEDVG